MKLMQQYIHLRECFSPLRENEAASVTVDELAEYLECTRRNVLLILNRMSEAGWLTWKPKRGRGNRSSLFFHMPTHTLVVKSAKALVEKEDVKGALEQINRAAIPTASKEEFNQWLYRYFGYQSEVHNDRKIDTLRFPLSGPLQTLDPMSTYFSSETHLVKQMFDSLVKYNATKQELMPHLAHTWEIDAARITYTFYLRKGVLFHHGKEMTAQDVIYSLQRPHTLQKPAVFSWCNASIQHITVIDPLTVAIKLYKPNELFLHYLSTSRTSIVPVDLGDVTPERFAKYPIGTGPFKLIKHHSSMCVMEAFPHYFKERAHLDRVEVWDVPDLYGKNDAEHLSQFQVGQNITLPQSTSNPSHVKLTGTNYRFITLNTVKDGPLQNMQCRQWLTSLIDRREIIQQRKDEALTEASGFYQKSSGPLHNQHSDEIRNQLSVKSLELCTIPHYEADARIVQKLCQAAGLHLDVTLLSPDEFIGPRRLGADMILFSLVLDNDAELRLIDLYKSMQLRIADREWIERSIQQIMQTPLAQHRLQLFKVLEERLIQQHYIHFLHQKRQQTVYDHSVQGISADSLEWVSFKDVWIKGMN